MNCLLLIIYTCWLSDQTDFDFYKGVIAPPGSDFPPGSRTTEKFHYVSVTGDTEFIRDSICEHNVKVEVSHLRG